jgi:signal transduction histidine kinase
MAETFLQEMRRYVGFGPDDEAALRGFAPAAEVHLPAIADEFYARIAEHAEARRVLVEPGQIARLKCTLQRWMTEMLVGPWNEAYYELRARIGRTHVKIGLPQRYMIAAMNVIRLALLRIPHDAAVDVAIHKICDLELSIMVETYAEAYVGVKTRRAERLASLGTMAAGLAHEIRNPLNAAHLQLTLLDRRLSRSSGDMEKAREAATLAAGEVRRLGQLVGEFLDFARPQPLRRTRADLRQTAEVIASLLGPEASAAGIELAVEPGDPVCADYDDEKIKQVVHNLVRNAIEATGAGGSVRIRVTPRGGDAVLEVEDDGPGLPSPDAPIFEPFYTTKESGTGLGLAIVHRIITDHLGTVDVRSRPGHTVFSVGIPLPLPG